MRFVWLRNIFRLTQGTSFFSSSFVIGFLILMKNATDNVVLDGVKRHFYAISGKKGCNIRLPFCRAELPKCLRGVHRKAQEALVRRAFV